MTVPQELLPILQITLPLLFGMWLAANSQNKRLDDLINRVTAIEKRLTEIGDILRTMEGRLAKLEAGGVPPGPKRSNN